MAMKKICGKLELSSGEKRKHEKRNSKVPHTESPWYKKMGRRNPINLYQ